MIFGNKKINAFGLDISDVSIKVLQLKRSNKQTGLHAYGTVPLVEGIINNHMIVEEKKLADNILRAISSAKRIDTKYVVCSIPEAKSFVRTLEIPRMSEGEIHTAVQYELEQDIPIPVDQVYLDWQIINEQKQTMKVLVTATPKVYVDSLVSALHSIKLRPLGLELESQATARALISPVDATKPILIIDLSTSQTSFIIVRNGIIEYTSSIPVAGRAFTESISRDLGVQTAKAEELKFATGLGEANGSNPARQAMLPILNNIVDEIRNVMRFYEDHANPKQAIDDIFLCGGSAKLIGIIDYITAQLHQEKDVGPKRIILGNPWINVEAMAKKPVGIQVDALGYVTAIGLALRGCVYEDN